VAVLTEGYIAVFLLGALAGGGAVYLACRPVFTQLRDRARYWQKNAAGWEEQAAMRSKLLNAVLRLARDAEALDAVTDEDGLGSGVILEGQSRKGQLRIVP
jgi:hypothetical protein